MKSNGLYWTDSNNNSWSKCENTKKQAEEKSATMFCCHGCINCSNCRYCRYCSYCHDCSDCNDCSNCSNCSNCRYCRYCHDFTTNPMRYIGAIMGSRKSQTTTYWTADKNQVVCGCFRGTIAEFEAKVLSVHADNKYGTEYAKYIKIVRTIMEMEK
jgi:hypothetical protein